MIARSLKKKQSKSIDHKEPGVCELDVYPVELQGSGITWELAGDQGSQPSYDTSVAGPPQRDHQIQRHQELSLHTSECWDGQGQPHQPFIAAQTNANDYRNSFASGVAGYRPTYPHDYMPPHPVASLNNYSRLPTPPTASSPQKSSQLPSTREPNCHATDHSGINQCSHFPHPITYSSQVSSLVAGSELGDSHVPRFEDHAPSSQESILSPQHQPSYNPLYQRNDYNDYMFLHSDNPSYSFDEALPPYNAEPTHLQQLFQPFTSPGGGVQPGELPRLPVTTMRGEKRKRASLADACVPFFHPISCSICHQDFNGPYQKGNLKRHFRHTHYQESGTTDELDKICRACGNVYKRPDARRKHEWKKHRMEDAKPEKRRKEKQEA